METLLSNTEVIGIGAVAISLVFVLHKIVTNHISHSNEVIERNTQASQKHSDVLERLIELIDKKLS